MFSSPMTDPVGAAAAANAAVLSSIGLMVGARSACYLSRDYWSLVFYHATHARLMQFAPLCSRAAALGRRATHVHHAQVHK